MNRISLLGLLYRTALLSISLGLTLLSSGSQDMGAQALRIASTIGLVLLIGSFLWRIPRPYGRGRAR